MIHPAPLLPLAPFVLLAALFSYRYVADRRVHFLLWALGWWTLALRQLAVVARTSEAAPSDPLGGAGVAAAGTLLLLGGVAYGRWTGLGRGRGRALATVLVLLAALALVSLAVAAPPLAPGLAAGLAVLVAAWGGTGWLVYRNGRMDSPVGAPLGGLSLLAWAVWLPAGIILISPLDPATWPTTFDVLLGLLVVVGMVISTFEESRARLSEGDPAALFEDAPAMVVVLQDGRIAYANRDFVERMGRSLRDLKGLDTLTLVGLEDRPGAEMRRARRARGELVTGYQIDLIDAAGERVPVVVHAEPIGWNGRSALKYELTDLTPSRQAAEQVRRVNAELRRMNEELERASRLQNVFLSNTTHELKTPLTSIMANTEILEYEMCGPINDEQRRVLSNISRNSQHLLEMISRLLDFSRQHEGAVSLRMEEVDPRQLLDAVAETVRPLLDETELNLEIQVAPELETCRLDGEKIYRVYLNLVENAIKFSSRGTIVARADIVDGAFEGSVVDEGIGIPADRLEDIFQPFIQVDASSTRPYPGVGLGLAICRQLIDLHGGRIWAESELDRGSAFRFRVPCGERPIPVADAVIEAGTAG